MMRRNEHSHSQWRKHPGAWPNGHQFSGKGPEKRFIAVRGTVRDRLSPAMKGHSRVLSFRHSGVESKPKPASPLFVNGAALMLGQCGRSVIGVVGAD